MASLTFGWEVIPLFLTIADRILAGEEKGRCSASMQWGPASKTSEPAVCVELFHNGPEDAGILFFSSLLKSNHDVMFMGEKPFAPCAVDSPPSLGKRPIPKDAPHMLGTSVEFMHQLYDEFVLFQEQEKFRSTCLVCVVHDRSKVITVGQRDSFCEPRQVCRSHHLPSLV